jgi:hypothetical protein
VNQKFIIIQAKAHNQPPSDPIEQNDFISLFIKERKCNILSSKKERKMTEALLGHSIPFMQ